MLRPAPPVDVTPLLDEERSELIGLLRALDAEAAATPTICDPWSVRDLAAHLLSDDISILSRGRDHYLNPAFDVDPADPAAMLAWIDAHNERIVEAFSFMSVDAIADLLVATGDLTKAYFSSLEPGQTGEEVVSWAGPDPAPNWLRVGREFTERWIHQQQIRDALKRPGLNGPSFVTPILSVLVRGVPPAYANVAPPVGTTVEISVAGRGGGAWAVRRAADHWDLLEGREREVDARVTLDQESMWRFLSRNISADDARHKAETDGPEELVAPFFSAVSVIVRTE